MIDEEAYKIVAARVVGFNGAPLPVATTNVWLCCKQTYKFECDGIFNEQNI